VVGAVVWGASNFVLLAILTRSMGAEGAGTVLVAIAGFNIIYTIAGLGSSSGLVRMISRHRATRSVEQIRTVLLVGLVPVAVLGVACTFLVLWGSDWLAHVFDEGASVATLETTFRAMAPFIPVAALYWAVIQGTRGFDTMRPAVLVDKVGRGILLPLLALVGAALSLAPPAMGAVWASSMVIALVPASLMMVQLVRDAEERHLTRAALGSLAPTTARPWPRVASEFWRFTAPRAVGQVSEMAVLWMDTLVVDGLLGATSAGIYAAGSRFLLPGLFVADGLMQVVGPRISGLLTSGRHDEAKGILRYTTGWQTAMLWPVYLVVLVFAPVLLGIFGPEVVAATGALRWLSLGVMLTALAGPAASVILMSGNSMASMVNTLVLVAVNLAGNLLLVPRYGLGAAGFTWAVTILVGALLPAIEARAWLDLSTFGAPGFLAAGMAVAAYAPPVALAWAVLGQTWAAVVLATLVGTAAYGVLLRRHGDHLELRTLLGAVRPSRAR
jgi:O-antigen/teichoic acid export membrane protein